MKLKNLGLVAISGLLFAGCASAPETAAVNLHLGMSRDELKRYYGAPLRIEPAPAGGENWFYRFVASKGHLADETGTIEQFGERTTYASVALEPGQASGERPVHVSPDGFVIPPLPDGKIAHK